MIGERQLIRDLNTLKAMLADGAWPRHSINTLVTTCAKGKRREIREHLLLRALAEQATGKPPASRGRAPGMLTNWEAGKTPAAVGKLVAATLKGFRVRSFRHRAQPCDDETNGRTWDVMRGRVCVRQGMKTRRQARDYAAKCDRAEADAGVI